MTYSSNHGEPGLLPWRRFWCPRDGSYAVDGGFLLDPESEYARFHGSDAVAYELLSAKRCLVLLGEPGTGKSSELRRMASEASGSPRAEPAVTLYRDLREYESMADIQTAILESTVATPWREGDGQLLLFLDSLDEALLSVEVIASRLASMLSGYPVERLTLRIACRTAEWPDFLGEALRGLWGDEAYGVYEITPLRRKDVRIAAAHRGLAPEAFLSAVHDREVTAFASKPSTLKLLLDLFTRTGGGLPQSQAALYREGLLHMCEGHDPDGERRASRRGSRYSAAQRFAIAARVAAVTILGNRAAVWMGPRADAPGADVGIAVLAGGTEPVGGDTIQVDDDSIRDVLANTGLFTSRGPRRMGWAHQTYAEFLATVWLLAHKMPLSQMEGLLRHPGDRDRKFVPQLHELVAWLAGMDREFRDLVLGVEPEVLLRTDVRTLDDADRGSLVAALLSMEEIGRLPFQDYFQPRRYDRLSHAGLADQLRPWIEEPERHSGARELAIEIAGVTGAAALSGALADVAVESSEAMDTRVAACRALARIGDPQAVGRLAPLAARDLPGDDLDELRGAALEALWPAHISSETLFGVLTSPKSHSFHGGYYKHFLRKLADTLDGASVPRALAWVIQNDWAAEGFPDLRIGIIRRAWDFGDDPAVLEALAEEISSDLRRHREWAMRGENAEEFAAAISAHPQRRRRLVERLVAQVGESGWRLSVRLVRTVPPLLLPNDFSWLLDAVSSAPGEAERDAWTQLAARRFTPDEYGHLDELYARRNDPGLAGVVGAVLGPEPLDSPTATTWRQHADQMRELEALEAERMRRETPPPAQEVIAAELERFNTGADAWIRIEWALLRSQEEEGGWGSITIRPSSTWVWHSLPEAVHRQVLDVARTYLRADVSPGETLMYDQWRGRAGYQAFLLLLDEEPATPRTFPPAVWERWVRAIVTSGRTGRSARLEDYIRDQELLEIAYRAAPDVVTGEVVALLSAENTEQKQMSSASHFAELREPGFQAALIELAFDPCLAARSVRQLLSMLLEQGCPAAERRALDELPERVPRGAAARLRALAIAEALFIDGSDPAVLGAWRFVRRSKQLGREFALSVATRGSNRRLRAFDEHQVGQLFTWLGELFPPPDPVYPGMHEVTREDEVRRWRNSCATELENRATPAAVGTLEALARRWKEFPWLNQTIGRAEAEMRRQTWMAATPTQLLELAAGMDKRFVASSGQLMDLVIESLGRMEEELQGELPAAANLWDERDGGARPKNEEHLSDEIARHLRRDLMGRRLVIGREVQISRPSRGAQSGKRTDIYIEAGDPSSPATTPLTLVVEVKGSWNPSVLEGIGDQLVGQYLARNPRCRHGLYVVGWYLCSRWIQEEGKARTRRLGSESALRSRLRDQARASMDSTRRIEAVVLDCSWASDEQS